MPPIRPSRLAAVLVAVALLLAPSAALADGDPASDILLIQDTFFPYQPAVSANVAAAVNATVARAKAAGFPLKVAVVAAVTDLGAVPDLFGQPQKYADFLDREISYNQPMKLLVVMPQGFGVANAGPAGVLAGRTVPPGTGADRLARAAIPAITTLAARAGHPITAAPIAAARGGGGGTSPLLTFGAPLVLVLLAGAAAGLSRRGRDAESATWDEDDDEDDDEEEPGGEERQVEDAAAAPAPEATPGEPTPADEADPVGDPEPVGDSGAVEEPPGPVGDPEPLGAGEPARHPEPAPPAPPAPRRPEAGP